MIKKILILSANPEDTDRLRLDKEVHEIEECLKRAKQREKFEIKSILAISRRDLKRALLDYEPQIVHFSGHGNEDGLMLEGELGLAVPISSEGLSRLFELFSNHVECVILNACYTEPQAVAINKYIKYVIGMPGKINDKAAIEFSVGFYDALGAGKSFEEAFKSGIDDFKNYSDLIPVLKKRYNEIDIYIQFPSMPKHLKSYFSANMKEFTAGFVGRDWLFGEFKDFILNNKKGYFVIEAEPGYGKTAWLSRLILERQLIHHFNIHPEGIKRTSDFMENVCHQLIDRYAIRLEIPKDGLNETNKFLKDCLGEAAANPNNHPIIIAIDALDEAESLNPGESRLRLPYALEDGVYFIVTMRPRKIHGFPGNYEILNVASDQSKSLELSVSDPRNLSDIENYIRLYINSPQNRSPFIQQINRLSLSDEDFIREFMDKSEGNFMYVRHVLPAFIKGDLQMKSLPRGLIAYYLGHWNHMKNIIGASVFDDEHEFILSELVEIEKPLSIDDINQSSGLKSRIIQDVLDKWSPFLSVSKDTNGISRYRIYHKSFSEFLKEMLYETR